MLEDDLRSPWTRAQETALSSAGEHPRMSRSKLCAFRAPTPVQAWTGILAVTFAIVAGFTAKPCTSLAAEPQAAPSPREFVLTGKTDYLFHCATCHGLNARGDGPAAGAFRIRPSNLTLLARRNGGVFPEKQIFAAIEGSAGVQAHGTREMPVWGNVFEAQGANTYNRAETAREVRERIQNLVDYLKSIQAK